MIVNIRQNYKRTEKIFDRIVNNHYNIDIEDNSLPKFKIE